MADTNSQPQRKMEQDRQQQQQPKYSFKEDEEMSALMEKVGKEKRAYQMSKRSPAKLFVCPECDKVVKYPSKFAEHMRIHTGEKPFSCGYCGESFAQKHRLKLHMKRHQGLKPYQCSYCNISFATAVQRRFHERCHQNKRTESHSALPDFESIPSTSAATGHYSEKQHGYDQLETLDEVMADVDQGDDGLKELYSCPIEECQLHCYDLQYVEAHIAVNHPEISSGAAQNYLAVSNVEYETECPEEFDVQPFEEFYHEKKDDNEGEKTVEYYDHMAPPPHPTNEIIVETSELNNLEVMEYVDTLNPHYNDGMLEDEVLDHQQSNNMHVIGQIVVDDGSKILEVDGTVDDDRVRVAINPGPPKRMGKHENHGLVTVEIDAATLEMTAPVRHLQQSMNGGEKRRRKRAPARNLDWIIDAIAKGIHPDDASPHNRKKAMVHKCEYCGKVDKYPSKIIAHMRTHTGERPYKCEICGLTFNQKTPLRLHLRRHLDQKPYMCIVNNCGARFVSGALLNRHAQLIHFQTKKYVCIRGCGRSFANQRNKRNHEESCTFENGYGRRAEDDEVSDEEEEEPRYTEPVGVTADVMHHQAETEYLEHQESEDPYMHS